MRGLGALEARVPALLRGTAAYHVPAPAQLRAKLDANELPYAWPDELRTGLAARLAQVSLERYPDAGAQALRAIVSTQLGVAGDQIVFGNGSDELIAMLCAGFAGGDAPAILYPTPSFVYYRMAAMARGLGVVEVPLRRDFTLDEPAMRAAIAGWAPSVVFLAMPNNPTGTLWRMGFACELATEFPATVIVSDEAYLDYAGGQTLLPALAAHPNLVVMRTLSKIGLAGLRVGFLVGAPAITGVLEKVRPPYNLSSLDQAAAGFALTEAQGWCAARCAEVVAERAPLAAALATLPGVTVYPSEANLVMCRFAAGRANTIAQALAARGILIRNFDTPNAPPALAGCLRVTVGTPAENALLLVELRSIP